MKWTVFCDLKLVLFFSVSAMPNIIPPIVSSTPPPLDPIDDDNDEDENDDDFGDFAAADFASHTGNYTVATIREHVIFMK